MESAIEQPFSTTVHQVAFMCNKALAIILKPSFEKFKRNAEPLKPKIKIPSNNVNINVFHYTIAKAGRDRSFSRFKPNVIPFSHFNHTTQNYVLLKL